jgi:ATP-dependent helicase/nuclease subunit A
VPSYLRGAARLERAQPIADQLRLFPVGTRGASGSSTLSYSSLSELERCGYRYYLERVLGVAEQRADPRSPASGGALEARARGTLVHDLLEAFDPRSPRAPTADQVAERARALGIRTNAQQREEVAGLIAGALAAAPAARIAGAGRIRREHPFAFTLTAAGPGGPLLNGVIDLLADERDGGCLVVDYKSDRVEPGDDLDALVERDYSVQRLVYALAVLRTGVPRVEIAHWFLERPAEWVAASSSAGERQELEDLLAMRIQRAQAGGFAVSEHPHRGLCQTCPGRGGLCSWGEAETSRESPLP